MPKKIITRLDRKKDLYLADAGIKGRGVYCRHDIRKGEELETTPAILLSEAATRHIDKTILIDYAFSVGKLSKKMLKLAKLKNSGTASCIVMGILSYCNHGEEPNAEVIWQEEGDTLYYILRATRNIPKGTEICTTYGRGWFDDRK